MGSAERENRRMLTTVLCLVGLCLPGGELWADVLDDLASGHWLEVPDSQLSAVVPDPAPPGLTGPRSITGAWSGGAYDTTRDRLIVWGGGHGDYGGNEFYTFDVNGLYWERTWGPSPDIPAPGGSCEETYADGNPASRHTYEGLEYLPSTDSFWSQGGSLYCGAGHGTYATWTFDFGTTQWERREDALDKMLGVVTARDPLTGHVFHQAQYDFAEYAPENDTWTARGVVSAGWWRDNMTADIDLENRLFVAVGDETVRVWNLSTWGYSTPQTTGGNVVVNANAPGFVWDPVMKRLVAWAGGTSVYSLDTDTWTWTEHPAAPTNTVVPSEPVSNGTFGRFRYVPSKNVYILVNRIDDNVYFYRPTNQGEIFADGFEDGLGGWSRAVH